MAPTTPRPGSDAAPGGAGSGAPAVDGADEPSPERRARTITPILARLLLGAGLPVVVWFGIVHGVAGVDWHAVTTTVARVPVWRLACLAAIWAGGISLQGLVLDAALPGLGTRRCLVLNLSGSFVANLLPLGGAAAAALNWRLLRSWGRSGTDFAAVCFLSNALHSAAKLALPAVTVLVVAAWGTVPTTLWWLSAVGTAALTVGAAVTWAVERRLTRQRHALPASGAPTRTPARRDAAVRRAAARLLGGAQLAVGRVEEVVRGGWRRLVGGSAAYVVAQVVLSVFALQSVGGHVPFLVALVAAVVERVGTVLPLSPAGTGVAEAGAVAWLLATGVDPVTAVAGVLLVRLFLVVIEVPVGGLLLGGWAWSRLSSRSGTAAAA